MAGERAVIAKECALIRTAFKDESAQVYRHRNVAKLMYVDMLGYPTHFGQMEVLKLIAAGSFSEKRVGYLALSVLLDETTEVLMLVTQSLKNDLLHSNPYIVGLALCALGNVASADIARDFAREVEKLMRNSNPYIRKKATLCAVRMVRKVPELVEDLMYSGLNSGFALLEDKSHGALLGAMSLVLHVVDLDKKIKKKARKHVPQLISTLKQLVVSSYDPDHDIAGVTDPFLQVKIIQLLRKLAVAHPSTSEEINDVLAQVATNTESTKNPGNAILYECVQTIMSIEAEPSLRVLAINILGRFLINRDNNIRYVALNTLCKVEKVDAQAIQRHRNTIVECLKDIDPSIRRRALDLIYSIVNKNNVRTLVKDLLNFLVFATFDNEFKSELTAKICSVVERFAPNRRWHIDSIIRVLETTGHLAQEKVASDLALLIAATPDLHVYSVHRLYHAMVRKPQQDELIRVGSWCVGEYGDDLLEEVEEESENDTDTAEFAPVSERDVLSLFAQILKHHDTSARTRAYLLTALLKLVERFDQCQSLVRDLLAAYKKDISLELQQRSVEFSSLAKRDFTEVRSKVLVPMPVPDCQYTADEESVDSGSDMSTDGDVTDDGSDVGPDDEDVLSEEEKPKKKDRRKSPKVTEKKPKKKAPKKTPAPVENEHAPDIFDIFGNGAAAASSASSSSAPKATSAPTHSVDFLADLLGGGNNGPSQSASNNTPSAADDLLGAMGGLGLGGAPRSSSNNGGAFDMLGNGGGSGAAAAPSSSSRQTLIAFDKDGLQVEFELKSSQASSTEIEARFSNRQNAALSAFSFQVAVPKYLKAELSPASSSVLPPHSSNVTQRMVIRDNSGGQKSLMVRMRITFTLNGQPVTHTGQLREFNWQKTSGGGASNNSQSNGASDSFDLLAGL